MAVLNTMKSGQLQPPNIANVFRMGYSDFVNCDLKEGNTVNPYLCNSRTIQATVFANDYLPGNVNNIFLHQPCYRYASYTDKNESGTIH